MDNTATISNCYNSYFGIEKETLSNNQMTLETSRSSNQSKNECSRFNQICTVRKFLNVIWVRIITEMICIQIGVNKTLVNIELEYTNKKSKQVKKGWNSPSTWLDCRWWMFYGDA